MTFEAQLIERLEPWLTPDLERFAKAVGVMFDATLEVAEEEGEDGRAGYVPAYGKLLNPNTCPFKDLGYLGNFIGVEIPKVATEAEARALVKAEAGLKRGTTRSVEEAIKAILGAEPFTIQERTSASGTEAAYHFNVLVGTGLATSALKEAIEAAKPAGLQFSVLEGEIWLLGGKKWETVTAGKTFATIKVGEY